MDIKTSRHHFKLQDGNVSKIMHKHGVLRDKSHINEQMIDTCKNNGHLNRLHMS